MLVDVTPSSHAPTQQVTGLRIIASNSSALMLDWNAVSSASFYRVQVWDKGSKLWRNIEDFDQSDDDQFDVNAVWVNSQADTHLECYHSFAVLPSPLGPISEGTETAYRALAGNNIAGLQDTSISAVIPAVSTSDAIGDDDIALVVKTYVDSTSVTVAFSHPSATKFRVMTRAAGKVPAIDDSTAWTLVGDEVRRTSFTVTGLTASKTVQICVLAGKDTLGYSAISQGFQSVTSCAIVTATPTAYVPSGSVPRLCLLGTTTLRRRSTACRCLSWVRG